MDYVSQLLTAISSWTETSENKILSVFVLLASIAFASAVIKSILRTGILLFFLYVAYIIFEGA